MDRTTFEVGDWSNDSRFASEGRRQRAISVLLVIALHALLILALLRFMVSPPASPFRTMPETHLFELIINTARPAKPDTRPDAPPVPARPALPTIVPGEPSVPAVPAPMPDIRGFGQALTGCAPENLANLDAAQRSHCQNLGTLANRDSNALDYRDHTGEVPGAKLWARELARKKAPLLLPCGNAKAVDFVYTGACILANIANGFTFQKQYENQPGYSDSSGK